MADKKFLALIISSAKNSGIEVEIRKTTRGHLLVRTPKGTVTVSSGPRGGDRSVENTIQCLRRIGIVLTKRP